MVLIFGVYPKIIYLKADIVHTMDISQHFNLDPSTITKTIQEMSLTDCIEHIPNMGICGIFKHDTCCCCPQDNVWSIKG